MDVVEITRLESGVIKIDYPQKHITLDIVEEVFKRASSMIDGPSPFIISGNRILYVDYDVLKFTASPEYSDLVSAQAILTRTRVERLLGSLYMKTHPTNYLNQCFVDEASALAWLASVK